MIVDQNEDVNIPQKDIDSYKRCKKEYLKKKSYFKKIVKDVKKWIKIPII